MTIIETIREYNNSTISMHNAVKTLRTNIQFSFIDSEFKTLVVTSANPGEGKSTLSVLLAASMAETGKKTLLVNMDFYKDPEIRVSKSKWYEIVSGEVPLEQAISYISIGKFDYLDADCEPEKRVELIDSMKFSNIVDQLKAEYDIIIFDTPPLGMFIDAAILGSMVDGAIVVISSGKVHAKKAKEVIEQLKKSNAKILGVVLNKVVMREENYYGYGHYRYKNTKRKSRTKGRQAQPQPQYRKQRGKGR